ncbi:MAG: LPS export ABC transporter permease LptG [Desulfobacteraceae bacterium 4484_190.3]|nr:MAG: LPS export ABC transporter permease LptG [Desulfobacteraceae bacterium 4484_190.3]
MSVLDRYITREFFKIFLLIILSLVGLYLIVDFFERIRMFLSNHATFYQILSYFFFEIPMILSLMLPVSVLLSSLLTFSILSKNSEIIAMKANGISLYRTSLPVIIISIIVCIFSFFLNEFITPYTNQQAKEIKLIKVQKRQKLGSFKKNQIWFRSKKGIYNFNTFDPKTCTLRGIKINYLDHDMNLKKMIVAKTAKWKNGKWIFYNLIIIQFPSGELPILKRVRSEVINLPEKPSDFMIVQKDTEEMGYFELRGFVKNLQSEGYDVTRYITDMYGKIAFIMISAILGIIGVSFSLLRSERSGGISQSVAMGIVIGFSYWVVFGFSISLGRSGTLPPLLSAWMANIILGAVAIFMFSRVKT